ncbi:MAG: hypothetical protein EBV06_17005, partial [Planctomycetia bacterium]|nr:hypothetical protein [Planctomycetia bacterium]
MTMPFLPTRKLCPSKFRSARPAAFFAAITALFFVAAPYDARADMSIYETYVVITGGPSSSGQYYYEGKDNGGTNTPFANINQSINLLASPTLTLNGGQVKTSASSGDYQNSNNYEAMLWRFYSASGSAPSYTSNNLTFAASQPAYPNYLWESTGFNANLLTGVVSGSYKMDVYFSGNGSYFSGGQQYYTSSANTTAVQTANFSFYYGATGAGTQSSAFSGSGTFVKTGTGTYTLDRANTFTGGAYIDAGAVALTAANAATNGLIAIGQEASGGGDAKLVLNAANGTTFTNNILVRNTGGNRTIEFNGAGGVTNTIQGNITNNNGFQATNANGSLILNGVLSGSGGFEKVGSGTVFFSGSSSNSQSGTYTVNGGTLVLNKSANTAAIAGSLTIASGATLRTDAANQLNDRLVTVNGTFNLNDQAQSLALASTSGSAAITLGSATMTINNTGSDSFAGVISGTGGVTKTGAGAQTLSGVNTFTGKVQINQGTLSIAAESGLGGSVASLTADQLQFGGGTLAVTTGFTMSSNRGITLNSNGGTINVAASQTFGYGGVIAGAAGNNFTKTGSGQLTLSGVNTYSGKTIINGGAISIAADNALGTAPGLVVADQLTFGSGTLAITAGLTMSSNRGITLNSGGGTIDVASSQTLSYGGIIAGSGNGLTKAGSGILSLSGANTYTGTTTIGAGTLQSGAANIIADTSAVSITSGAVFDLNGNSLTI